MRTIFLVLSFVRNNVITSRVLCNADLLQNNYISIDRSGYYYSDLYFNAGYTDTIQNNGVYDNKFHVYLATGMSWGNKTTLYFGAYNIPNTMSYPAGTRIAAIGIFNRIITSTEINTIQSWFNSKNFN